VLIAIAKQTGVAGYPGDGANRWPAGHTLDVGHLYRLALEEAPAGTRWHAVGDEGIPMREIAQSIGHRLGIPAASIPDDRLDEHFGFLAMLIGLDNPDVQPCDPADPRMGTDAPRPHRRLRRRRLLHLTLAARLGRVL
jgi:nucleoside-diphosphate-sugar epimerase